MQHHFPYLALKINGMNYYFRLFTTWHVEKPHWQLITSSISYNHLTSLDLFVFTKYKNKNPDSLKVEILVLEIFTSNTSVGLTK